MTYEMAMMMNWLLVAAGLLASDAFSSLFDDLFGGDDDDDVAPDDVIVTDVDPDDGDDMLGLNTGLGAGDETSEGTEFDDTILGQAGNDSISGGLGDDVLEGNTGDDSLVGGEGSDVLAGGGDTDTLFSGEGNDVLSSDRVDADADWIRGDAEQLDGGAGDDKLFFSGEDVATGGEGDDAFGLIDTGEGPGFITDFNPDDDNVTIYVDGLNEAETAPAISYATDPVADTTTVSLDGDETLILNGQFTAEDLGVTLADPDDIDFEALA